VSRNSVSVAVVIAALVGAVFAPTRHFDFVNYDDVEFVVENPHVANGLRPANVRWAFAEAYSATGGPLTWISHMADVETFGLNPGAHHLVNVTLHAFASIALFGVLLSATGALGRSALVACLFAVHPQHVESVAWISERKDILSGLFWFVTIAAYLAYVGRPSLWRYVLVVISLILGLLSKPMIATLPVALLLLDYWPLARLSWSEPGQLRSRVLEKLPLLVISLIALALTLAAQSRIGAVASAEQVPLWTRVMNACIAIATYVRRTFVPHDLAVFYPYRSDIALPLWLGSAIVLGAVTALAIRTARQAPYLTTGWLWFLVTLTPVAGIVQVGGQAMADRFTYIPLIGVFVMLVWGGHALLARFGATRTMLAAAVAVIVLCVIPARAQVWHWQNSITLWQHALDVTRENGRAHANLGVALARSGDGDRAIDEYRAALELQPADAKTHNNLALALEQRGQTADAVTHLRQAVALDPAYANAHNNLANALAETGHADEALAHHREAISLEPGNALARANLAITLGHLDRVDEGIAVMRDALQIDPRQAEWHFILGVMLMQAQQPAGAQEQFSAAIAIDPSHERARAALLELSTPRGY
jgi:Flp pilus assembly protein TadD